MHTWTASGETSELSGFKQWWKKRVRSLIYCSHSVYLLQEKWWSKGWELCSCVSDMARFKSSRITLWFLLCSLKSLETYRNTKHSSGRSLRSANTTAGQETWGDGVLQHPNCEQSGNTRICQRHRRACRLLSLIQENLSATQFEDSPQWVWSGSVMLNPQSVCTGLRAVQHRARRRHGEKSSAL